MSASLQLELLGRVAVAVVLGAAIGIERELRAHPAGTRTHALVALGSAMFTIAGAYGFSDIPHVADPTRVAAQVASGIGFIGAGAILRRGRDISGLTTASTLWLSAAIGVACAAGEPLLAVGGTTVAMVVITMGRKWSSHLRGRHRRIVTVRYEVGHGTLSLVLRVLGAEGNVGRISVDDGSDDEGLRIRRLDVEVENLSPRQLAEAMEQLLEASEVVSVHSDEDNET